MTAKKPGPKGSPRPDPVEPVEPAPEPDAEPDPPEPDAEPDPPEPAPEPVEPAPEPDPATAAGSTRAWQRIKTASRPRVSRGQGLAALLVALLGFALVVQISQRDEQRLTGLRQSELVQILDNIGERRDRLAAEHSDLEAARRELLSGASGSKAAIEAAQARLDALGVLAGTLPAEGTGIQVFVSDPHREVKAASLLDLVQELRDAGAESIQIGDQRVVASTAFVDVDGGVAIEGVTVRAPYTVLAIGDGQTMATALEIPGGVLASLPQGSRGSVAVKDEVRITALRPVPTPRYAQPAATATAAP